MLSLGPFAICHVQRYNCYTEGSVKTSTTQQNDITKLESRSIIANRRVIACCFIDFWHSSSGANSQRTKEFANAHSAQC